MKRRYAIAFAIIFLMTLGIVSDHAVLNEHSAGDSLSAATPSEECVSPTPSPAPTPTPHPIVETSVELVGEEKEIFDAFFERLYADNSVIDNPDTQFVSQNKEPTTSYVLTNREKYVALATDLTESSLSVCESVSEALQDVFPDTEFSYRIESESLNWKYLGSVLWLLSERVSYRDIYEISVAVDELHSNSEYMQSVSFTVSIHLRPFHDYLYELTSQNRDAFMAADYIMCYLTTVYDMEGNEVSYEPPVLSEEYIATIGKPLPGRPVFYDRWYQGRSRNTRKHTGLDLHARRNTNIYSCTDGTVLFIGYRATPGYYVVIRDPQGYIYQYYHMSRLSDFLTEGQTVSAGDVIGYVGNTGNSDLNHLHLGLITPDCHYVRLYSIMKELYKKR